MTVKVDSNNLKEGLLGLVIAVVEVLKETLQRQAIYRLEGGSLRDEEAERLGIAFQKLDQAIEKIKKENNLGRVSDQIIGQLDDVINETVNKLINPEEWVRTLQSGGQDVRTI